MIFWHNGCENKMLNFAGYKIRKITEKDLPILLQWRNSDRIHSEMLTEHKITWKEHQAWFQKLSVQVVPLHLVLEYQNRPIGYVGFSECDDVNQRCSIGSYLGETEEVPVDAGMLIDYLGISYLFQFTKFNKVWSYVFLYNKRACKLNRFIGYTEEGRLRQHFYKNGHLEDVYVFSVLREEWPMKSKKIEMLYGGKPNE